MSGRKTSWQHGPTRLPGGTSDEAARFVESTGETPRIVLPQGDREGSDRLVTGRPALKRARRNADIWAVEPRALRSAGGSARHRFGRRRSERGAAAVEFAIVATLLVPLVAGIIDFGTLFQKRQAVQDSTRAGARVGSSSCATLSGSPISANCVAGNLVNHDAKIMQALRARLGSSIGQVTKIVFYRSVALDDNGTPLRGRMISACRETTVPGGVDAFCNVYGPNELALVDVLDDTALGARFSCTDLARFWCPTTRERARRAADAFIGVQVELRHPHIVRLFGSHVQITYRSVFRLDPNAAVPDRPRPLPVPPPPVARTTTTTSTTTTTTTTTLPPPTTTTIPPPTTTTLPPPTTTTTSTIPPPTTTTIAPPSTTTTTPPPTTTTVALPTTTTTTITTTTTTRPPRPCC